MDAVTPKNEDEVPSPPTTEIVCGEEMEGDSPGKEDGDEFEGSEESGDEKGEEQSSSESEEQRGKGDAKQECSKVGKLYAVEAVVDERFNPRDKVTEYLLKWVGYPSSENTWEPAEVFVGPSVKLLNEWNTKKVASKTESAPQKRKYPETELSDSYFDELDATLDELEEKEDDFNKLRRQLADIRKEVRELEAALETETRKEQKLEQEIANLQQQEKKLEEELDQVNWKVEELRAQIKEKDERLEKLAELVSSILPEPVSKKTVLGKLTDAKASFLHLKKKSELYTRVGTAMMQLQKEYEEEQLRKSGGAEKAPLDQEAKPDLG